MTQSTDHRRNTIDSGSSLATVDKAATGWFPQFGRVKVWAAILFPQDNKVATLRTKTLAVVAVALLTCLSVGRVGGAGALNTIWAEDGKVFYDDALHLKPTKALVTPYNGYLHFVPRVLAEVSRGVPLKYLAAYFSISGALVTSLLAVFVWTASRPLLKSPALQTVVAAPIALGWVAQSELGNNVVDLQWYFLYAAFWAALWNIESVPGRAASTTVLFCSIGSDPLTLLYLPIILARVWVMRNRRDWVLGLSVAAGVAYQGFGVIFMNALSSRSVNRQYDPLKPAWGYVVNVLGRGFWSGPGHQTISVILACAMIGVAFKFLPFVRRNPLVLTSIAFSFFLYGSLTVSGGVIASRYAAPSSALLITAIAAAAAADSEARHSESVVQQYLTRTLFMIAISCVVFGYSWGPNVYLRDQSPSWSGQLAYAAISCSERGIETVDIAIAPANTPHDWHMDLPCKLIEHRSDAFQLRLFSR